MIEISPFAPGYRAAGVLLHVTSLPSAHGIGDLGPCAFSWVDRLRDTGIGWWQSLPLGQTGYGNSPYQSVSSFAGNELLISPAQLISDGLLLPDDCQTADFDPRVVDFGSVIPFKRTLQQKVWKRFESGERKDLRPAFERFCAKQAHWLEDYALFRALKVKCGGGDYHAWPAELVHRVAAALAQAKRELKTEIDQVCFTQFLFFRQTACLKNYANAKGLSIIGDLPFFVSADSSDL